MTQKSMATGHEPLYIEGVVQAFLLSFEDIFDQKGAEYTTILLEVLSSPEENMPDVYELSIKLLKARGKYTQDIALVLPEAGMSGDFLHSLVQLDTRLSKLKAPETRPLILQALEMNIRELTQRKLLDTYQRGIKRVLEGKKN